MYDNIQKLDNIVKERTPIVSINFIDGPFLELKNFPTGLFNVEFYSDGQLIYETKLTNNMWSRLSKKYYADWEILIKDEVGNLVYKYNNDFTGKRVYISFESKSLGDSIAWFPYVEEFRKKHNCQVVVSTFMNHLFIDQYPDLEFVNPGQVVHNLIAIFRLGWFYNENGEVDYSRNPINFRTIPLQKTASDILGLDYKEIRPLLNLPKVEKKKKVGLGLHSTAQAKYWNNPNGWQEVVNFLNSIGYEVILYSKEEDGYMGNRHPHGINKFKTGTIPELIEDLVSCEFFIGLGSGLSWLAWACELPVILISGFSDDWAEMTDKTYRVINKSVCNSCFNIHKFDPGDWNWCPVHKGTERQFECTKQISSQMVIDEINKIVS